MRFIIATSPRARRRARMDQIRRECRRVAERRYHQQFVYGISQPSPLTDYYRWAMLGQGKWRRGGCPVKNCWACKWRGGYLKLPRDQRKVERARHEYQAWLRGEV